MVLCWCAVYADSRIAVGVLAIFKVLPSIVAEYALLLLAASLFDEPMSQELLTLHTLSIRRGSSIRIAANSLVAPIAGFATDAGFCLSAFKTFSRLRS